MILLLDDASGDLKQGLTGAAFEMTGDAGVFFEGSFFGGGFHLGTVFFLVPLLLFTRRLLMGGGVFLA